MIPFQRDMLLEMASELEVRAEKAASEMLAHKRRMMILRQRAAVLRDLADLPEPDPAP
jgi:hypothetical protein